MNNRAMVFGFIVMSAVVSAFAAGTVADVKARQRYPWNGKVDIDCTLSGTAGTSYALTVNARDKVGCTNLAVKAVSVEGGSASGNPVSVTPGTYRLVWDAGADLPNGFRCEKISISVSVSESAAGKKFMIVDLSSGGITYQASAPEGGWTSDEYLTTKMVFQRITPATFYESYFPSVQYGRTVTITRPYYISVSFMTKAQLQYINGGSSTDKQAYAGKVPYSTGDYKSEWTIYAMRGNTSWPEAGHTVDGNYPIGKLRSKTGLLALDLPTEAQFVLACQHIDFPNNYYACLDRSSEGYGWGEASVEDPSGSPKGLPVSRNPGGSRVSGDITSGVGYMTAWVVLCLNDID